MVKANWYPSKDDEKPILDFVFSRLEYALKCDPEYRNGNKANWDKFKRHFGKTNPFLPVSLKETVIYLARNPPMSQTAAGWNPYLVAANDWVFLIDAVSIVRNPS